MSDFLSGILGRALGGGAAARRGGASGMGGALGVAAAALVLQQLMKHLGNRGEADPSPAPGRPGEPATGDAGGGLLGGLLGGAAGGGPGAAPGAGLGGLLGGLDGLLGRLRGQGLGQQVDSWISTGPNEPVAPQRLEAAFDAEEVDRVARQAGTDRGTLLDEVGRVLPDLVDRMTPGGRVPRDPSEWQGQEGGISAILASLFGEERREGEGAPQGPATGRGASGEAGMPRFTDDPPGPAASGGGGPPPPRQRG